MLHPAEFKLPAGPATDLHTISKNQASNAPAFLFGSCWRQGTRTSLGFHVQRASRSFRTLFFNVLLLLLKPRVPSVISVCSPSRALPENTSQNSLAWSLQSPDQVPCHPEQGILGTRHYSPLPPAFQEVFSCYRNSLGNISNTLGYHEERVWVC